MIMWLSFLCFVTAFSGWLPNQQIPGPSSPANRSAWLQQITQMRTEILTSIHYNGSIFAVPQLEWTKTAYLEPQLHPFDRYFYDPEAHQYTVDVYLADLETRYGSIDSALVWPTYPNIGIDDRNQFDLVESLPGHQEGIKLLVAQLQARGVHVLWPYNPWDLGTRATGIPDEQSLLNLINSNGAEGFFGDTMSSIPESFYDISAQHKTPFALEPEGGGENVTLNWDTLGWGYWSYPYIPEVDLWKWLEPRHMTHLTDRWNHNRTDALQAAWFNGIGYETWENVWGCWNGMVPQDGEATRRVSHMLRFFGHRGFLQSPDWLPHHPTQQPAYIFSSSFPGAHGSGEMLFTLVNRANVNTSGVQLKVDPPPSPSTYHYYDCYHGKELTLSPSSTLAFDIEALGFGCVFATFNTSTGDLGQFLAEMHNLTNRSLASFSKVWHYLPQAVVPSPPLPITLSPPPGMIAIPAGTFHFQVSGVEVEGNDDEGVDVQYPWESFPHLSHEALLQMDGFFLDRFPVTNANYSAYLSLSKYVPTDSYNFLKEWVNGTFPQGWDNKPVTWVSLSEARAYCAFFHKRLPQEVEWQYAAQGPSLRQYPWGDLDDPSRYPTAQHGRTLAPGPSDVSTFSPLSDSVFGISDLVGNTWEYTSEFQDAHTRTVILRGGSYYYPNTSSWYFPQAKTLNTHGKYLLMDDAYERAGTLGFRCASPAPPCTTPLCLGFGPFPSPINLTTLGSLDWLKVGAQTVHKKGGGALSLSVKGVSGVVANAFPSTFVWSNGDPVPVSSSSSALTLNASNSLIITSQLSQQQEYAYLALFLSISTGRAKLSAILEGQKPQILNLSSATTANVSIELAFSSPSSSALSVTLDALEPCDSSLICGEIQSQNGDANLTSLGGLDWVHWGLGGPQHEDRKRNPVVRLLLPLSVSTPAQSFDGNPGTYSWSDGTPTAMVQRTATGIYVAGVSQGFKFSVKGIGSFVALRVFCGTWQASAKFTAQFPSGEAYSENVPIGSNHYMFTVYYSLGEEEELTVTWTQEDGSGNITLEAASVIGGETLVLVGGVTLSSERQDSPSTHLGFRTVVR